MPTESADASAGGTYTLLVALDERVSLTVGALGERSLSPGWYAYTGSALGPGGFARVDRHRRTARGESDTRHWHVDSLLGHPAARLDAVYRSPGRDAECAVARSLPGDRVGGFGCSDCGCASHLAYAPERATLADALAAAHAERAPGN